MYEFKTDKKKFYLVKEGDTLSSIADGLHLSPLALQRLNGIENIAVGDVLFLPPSGNFYIVQPGDDKVTLCGSEERYEQLNGTSAFFPGMRVVI